MKLHLHNLLLFGSSRSKFYSTPNTQFLIFHLYAMKWTSPSVFNNGHLCMQSPKTPSSYFGEGCSTLVSRTRNKRNTDYLETSFKYIAFSLWKCRGWQLNESGKKVDNMFLGKIAKLPNQTSNLTFLKYIQNRRWIIRVFSKWLSLNSAISMNHDKSQKLVWLP